MDSLRIRSFFALMGVVIALILVAPNVVDFSNKWWFSKAKLNYGLDIQGGLHLVMGVDVDGVVSESTHRLIGDLKTEFTKSGINTTEITAAKANQGEIVIAATDAISLGKIQTYMGEHYSTILQNIGTTELKVTYRYFDSYLLDYSQKVIHQSIETIRNRIDEFGVAEPSISQQGSNRILVQLPGMADAERAKELINTTAKLDFMMVSTEKSQAELQKLVVDAETAGGYNMATLKYGEYIARLNNDLKGKIPDKTVVYFQKNDNAIKMEVGSLPYLLKTDTGLGGGDLSDAFIGYGQYQEPTVNLRFNSAGSNKFADLTAANVGHQMAIVLDKVVKSAPNIQERIGGGSAVINLGGSRDRDSTMNEAKMISTALRAGALPASLEQLEERRIGPTLGADSIAKAKIASYVGALLVIIFMFVYYKQMGVVANLGLAINILSVFALLTALGATLTLPGIAGIALTVGFAVDANVLINERIREELHLGTGMKLALQEGYSKAMSAILDGNITVAATAIVLLYFGTGPVRGFAVTLLVGIITTLFANVFVSKVIVDHLIYRWGVKKLSV